MTATIISAILFSIIIKVQCSIHSQKNCWSSGNGFSAQWWDEGTQIDRGKYWYLCKKGELKPMGCLLSEERRINLYEKFIKDGYEMQCALSNYGYIQYIFTACIDENGERHADGSNWDDPEKMYWFECIADGSYLKTNIGGCISHDKEKRLRIGSEYEYQEYIYKCTMKQDGSIQLCSSGCVHNDVRYKIGDQWPDNEYLYYCKLKDGRSQKVCIGCQHEGKRLYDGDRYQKNRVVFQCEVRPDKHGHRPIGCVVEENGVTVEKVVGCKWYKGIKNFKIEQTCVLEGNKTVVKTLGCILIENGFEKLYIRPNKYTIWNRNGGAVGVTCQRTDNQAKMNVFNVNQLAIFATGLQYEQPYGK